MLLWQIGAEWEESRNHLSNILVQKSKKCSYKSSMEEKKFYIFSNGEAQGPFSERGLELLCAQKRITGETLICFEGNQNWMPYSDFLKNRPVMINESIPEEAVSQTVSQGFQEVKIPFTSMTVQAFGVMGGIIIILSILAAVVVFIFGVMSKNAVALPIAILWAVGIFLGSLLYGGVFIAIANIVQCQLRSVDLLKKIVEQTKK